jgi:hypothetical protein
MMTRPESALDVPLRLLADELAAQRGGEGDAPEIDERMAYLEEAMAGARQARRFTSPRGGGTTG